MIELCVKVDTAAVADAIEKRLTTKQFQDAVVRNAEKVLITNMSRAVVEKIQSDKAVEAELKKRAIAAIRSSTLVEEMAVKFLKHKGTYENISDDVWEDFITVLNKELSKKIRNGLWGKK